MELLLWEQLIQPIVVIFFSSHSHIWLVCEVFHKNKNNISRVNFMVQTSILNSWPQMQFTIHIHQAIWRRLSMIWSMVYLFIYLFILWFFCELNIVHIEWAPLKINENRVQLTSRIIFGEVIFAVQYHRFDVQSMI